MDKIKLREYLEQVRLLEADIYYLNETEESLKRDEEAWISSLTAISRHRKEFTYWAEPTNRPEKKSFMLEWLLISLRRGLIIFTPIVMPFALSDTMRNIKKNRKQIEDFDERHKAWQERDERTRKEEEDQQKQIHEAYEKADIVREKYKLHYAEIKQSRDDTFAALQALYNVGIIYKKYRSFVPVSMFCEYMDSGLRTELEGVNGMYDLYERQLAAQMIVGELKTINQNLEAISGQLSQIQRNQILIYEAVQEGNRIASDIRLEVSKLHKQTVENYAALGAIQTEMKAANESAKLTALHSKVAARRVDALAKIAEYEFAAEHPHFPSP